MTHRLRRITQLIASLTVLAAALSLVVGTGRPLGIVIGGAAGLLEFVLIAQLAAQALRRRPSTQWVVPLAFMKTLVLIGAAASALLLPPQLVDGVSFALGVTMLPLAIVVDALLPLAPVPAPRGAV